MKVACVECGRPRDPWRPVLRRVGGAVAFACRQCWRTYEYAEFFWVDMTDEDLAALRVARRTQ